MDQQLQLPLESGGPFPNGLSDWRHGKPPFVGWWETRPLVMSDRRPLIMRRWWNGTGWSQPVMIGDDDVAAEQARARPGSVAWALIAYRGLADPPKEGYAWALDEHHRSNMAVASRTRVPLVA